LLTLGFTLADDGTLVAPTGAVVTFTPTVTGQFYLLKISIDGNAVVAVLSKTALKFAARG
jgi:hypothetical protein